MNGARRLRFCAPQEDHIGSVDPHALKIPAGRAEYSLAEIALSPFQPEPAHFGTSAQYWLNIQNRFDPDSLDKAAIERDVIPKQAA